MTPNACTFTEEGYITVDAYQDGPDIILSVQDTGSGNSN